MGFFKKHKESRELDAQDRAARRDEAAAAYEAKDAWRDRAKQMSSEYASAIQAASSVDIAEAQRTAQRVQRITSHGEPGRATVVSARELGPGMAGVGVTLELLLSLVSGPGAPRPLIIQQDVMGAASSYPPGLELPVRIDPADENDAMIWTDVQSEGTPATADAPNAAAGTDRLAHLDAIAKLRERGMLSEEQFQEAKAKLLASE